MGRRFDIFWKSIHLAGKTCIRMEGRPIKICCVEYVEYQIGRLRLLLQEDFGEFTDMLSCTYIHAVLRVQYMYLVL